RYSSARGHHVDGSSAQASALLHQYAEALREHRLSAYGMGVDAPPVRFDDGRASIDWRGYDEEMARYFETEPRFTVADVRATNKAATDAEKIAYQRAFAEHFAQKKWKPLLFFYAKDEPKPADYPTVLEQSR